MLPTYSATSPAVRLSPHGRRDPAAGDPCSWVILTGDFSYKLKKPIKLEFLDMTSLSHRHLLCQEELRLKPGWRRTCIWTW